MTETFTVVTLRIPRHFRAFIVSTAMDRGKIEQVSDLHPLIDAVTDADVQTWVAGMVLAAISSQPGSTELAAEFLALNETEK